MSLRNRMLVSAVALCAVLPLGCMQAVVGRNPAVFEHLNEIPDLSGAVPSSPYHPQTTPPVVTPTVQTKPEPHPPSAEPATLVGREVPPKETPAPLPELPPLSPTTSVARAAPVPTEEPIVQALRAYLLKHPADALQWIEKYPKANQEMLLSALPLLARLTEGNLDNLSPAEADELATKQVRRLEDMLRERAALTIDDLRFCTAIDNYGQVEAHAPEFRGGAGDQVGDWARVYIPLRNVVNAHTDAGYETWLVGKAQVRRYDPNALFDNKLVCDLDDIKPQRLVSPSQRHEYFLAYGFWIPKSLPPGKYQLCIEVRDVTAQMTNKQDTSPASFNVEPHRVAKKTISFEVKDPALTVRGASPSEVGK